jgi:hypothetical protein
MTDDNPTMKDEVLELTTKYSPARTMLWISDYNDINWNQNKLRVYIFATLIYLGINIGLFGLNFKDQDFIESNYYLPFHLLEFWAIFVFTLIEAFVLVSTGTLKVNGSWLHRLQLGLAGFDILYTLMIAIIFSMDPEVYEVPAHYMEYSAQVLITLINFVYVFGFGKTKSIKSGGSQQLQFGLAVIAFVMSIMQFLIYTEAIPTPPGGERSGHFFEFSTESLNACMVLYYSILAYMEGERHEEAHYTKMHEEA